MTPTEEKALEIRAYWTKRLGPFFDPAAPMPRRLRNARKYYDDMLFLMVVDEIIKRKQKCPNPS